MGSEAGKIVLEGGGGGTLHVHIKRTDSMNRFTELLLHMTANQDYGGINTQTVVFTCSDFLLVCPVHVVLAD